MPSSYSSSVFCPRRLEVFGLGLHVGEMGEGEPVVLVHGLGVSSRYFEALAGLLAEKRYVIAPDLPGWGRSERPSRVLGVEAAAEVLAELIRMCTVRTPALVANSLGCQVVIALAQRRPELVGRLVLIGPTVDPRYRSWARQSARLALDWVGEPRSLWPIVLGDYVRMGPRRLIATARAALNDRPECRLPGIRLPVLVLRGERDALTTLAWARKCALLAPEGRFVTVPQATHAAHFSHPWLVARLIESFLAEGNDRLT